MISNWFNDIILINHTAAVKIGQTNRIPSEFGRFRRVQAGHHIHQQMHVHRMYILCFGPNQRHQLVVEKQQTKQHILDRAYLLRKHAGDLIARLEPQRIRIDTIEQHAKVRAESFDYIGEQLLCAAQLVAQIIVVVSGKDFFNQRQRDHAYDLIVDVGKLELELLDAFVGLARHTYKYEMAFVQKNNLVLAGDHMIQLVLVVAFDDRNQRLQQTHKGDQLHFIAVPFVLESS